MASENETVADIVAQLRAAAHIQNADSPRDVLKFADRIEAAHQREVAELKRKMNDVVCENEALRDACGTCGAKREREATREKSSQVGNAAKMREALSMIVDACVSFHQFVENGLDGHYEAIPNYDGGVDDFLKCVDDAKAAISAQPRNCDVGSVDEQAERFYAFCGYHRFQSGIKGMCSSLCPCIRCRDMCHCITKWAQMPYEGGGREMSVERPEGGIVYSLRLHNDSQTVIGRVKNALNKATFPFYGCVFEGKPWPDGVNILHREIIEQSLRLIWKGDGNYTDGYVNETDEFLDAIGLPKRERGSLIRTIHDCEGRVCKYCGVRGFNRRYPGDRGRAFYIYPDGSEVCSDCEDRIECGLDPLAWRGESKEGVAK